MVADGPAVLGATMRSLGDGVTQPDAAGQATERGSEQSH
ncbi:hypothetical protein I549_0573 [Mycobacterium avium subsp. avium 2285 (R)]|nr:hypothetical protein I549_0573 [Mycobacterium avium subsp. avium 2285 (R)]